MGAEPTGTKCTLTLREGGGDAGDDGAADDDDGTWDDGADGTAAEDDDNLWWDSVVAEASETAVTSASVDTSMSFTSLFVLEDDMYEEVSIVWR